MHVMIDLETLSSTKTASIISLGAVKFDPHTTELGESFYVAISPKSCEAFNLTISADTVMWWLRPERNDAREALLWSTSLDLPTALEGFAMWFGEEDLPVWGNGATFDNVILRHAYEVTGLKCPWSHKNDRCHRTMRALAPHISGYEIAGVQHHALSDAKYQASQLQRIVKHLGLRL